MTFCDLALVRRKATKTSLMNIQTSWFGCTILPINSLCICQNNNVFLTTVWTIQVCLHNIFTMLTLLKKPILDNQEIHQYDCNLKLPPICIFHQYAWKSLWHNHSVHHLHSKYVQTQWLTWYASTRFFQWPWTWPFHLKSALPVTSDVGNLSSTCEHCMSFHFQVNSGHRTDR